MSKRTLKPIDLNLDEPGKDLSRLFAASLSGNSEARPAGLLPIVKLLDNPYQPRLRMDEESLDDLARVITGQGFQGVLVARPHPEEHGFYQLTAGHRRREAARRAGLSTLPVVVQELSNEEMVTLAITEYIQRDDLTPLEEGRIYLLMSEEMGYTLEQMSKEIGKTVGYIYNRLRAARAPADVQELVQNKPDSLRAVANLIKVSDPAERAEIISRLLDGRMTTDDLPSYISALASDRRSPSSSQVAQTTPLAPLPSPPPIVSDSGRDGVVLGGATSNGHALDMVPSGAIESAPPLTGSDMDQQASHGFPIEHSTVLVDGVEVQIERNKGRLTGLEGGTAKAMEASERAERARIRARRARISRTLGLILAVSDGLRDGESLTEEERLELATIAVVAERLCDRFGISKDE